MEYKHWIDRAGYRVRPYLFWVLLPATPIWLFGSAKMVKLAIESWPWWASPTVLISQFLVLAGIAALIDSQQERLKTLEDALAARPPRSSPADPEWPSE